MKTLTAPHSLSSPDLDSHNPFDRPNSRSFTTFKDEQAELDELVHGMLREIQSIPDTPTYSTLRPFTALLSNPATRNYATTLEREKYDSPRFTSSVVSVNGNKRVMSPG